ncbi:MAG TPA: hypothetical protein VIV11_07170 [Kofleriaceae bacterium]
MRCCWLLALVGCGRIGFGASDGANDGSIGDGVDIGDATVPTRVAYIKASNTETFDDFGYALAVSADGTTLAVGAPQEDSGAATINGNEADNNVSANGAVYIFVRSDTTWTQQAYLKTNNPGANDFFGAALALSADGNTLVATAIGEDGSATNVGGVPDDDALDAGAAYVFARIATTWTQQAYLKASNSNPGDRFGIAAAISASGDVIAIGADFEASNATGVNGNQMDNSAATSGAVYTFTRSGTTWSPNAYLKASNTNAGDAFGEAVALSADGSTLVVGAPSEDSSSLSYGDQMSNGTMEAGAAYVFTFAGTWSQQAYLKSTFPEFGDFFAKSIAVSADGNVLLASGPGEDMIIANSGAAYLLTRAGTTWSHAQRLKASNAGDNDQFAADLALANDGNTVVIGAPLEDSSAVGLGGNQLDDGRMDSGACYAFARSGTAWSQLAYGKALAPTTGDQMGYAMAVSGNGAVIAVAMPNEDSAARGIDGDATDESATDSGAVIVFY